MLKLTILEDYCKSCGLCVSFCPKKILKISDKLNSHGFNVVVCIDETQCTGCGNCTVVCPDAAIELQQSTVDSRQPTAKSKEQTTVDS